MDDAIAGHDLHPVEFLIRACRQGFPDARSRATVFDIDMLARDLTVAVLRRTTVVTTGLRALIVVLAGTTRQTNRCR